MGGFQINGCGARDYFTKVKYLGDEMCPVCKKVMPFYLEKGKYKVSVFWVPTVTLKERYAVMCKKCKNGNWIEEDVAQKLLGGDVNVPVAAVEGEQVVVIPAPSEAGAVCAQCGAEVSGAFCGNCGAKYIPPEEIIPPLQEAKPICAQCGAEVSGAFCGNCGAKYIPPEEIISPVQEAKPICAQCGAEVSGAFCGNCGTKYTPQGQEPASVAVRRKPVCVKCGAELDGVFCGNCGTRNGVDTAGTQRSPDLDAKLAKLYQKADGLMNMGDYAQELNVLNEALVLDRNNVDTLTKIGRCYRALGYPDKALEIYRQALAIDPKSGVIYTNIGTILLLRQEWSAAAKQYEQGLRFLDKTTSDYWTAQANYAVAVARLGDPRRAEALILEAEMHGYQNGKGCRSMGGITS